MNEQELTRDGKQYAIVRPNLAKHTAELTCSVICIAIYFLSHSVLIIHAYSN